MAKKKQADSAAVESEPVVQEEKPKKQRRSAEEVLADLQAKIDKIKAKQENSVKTDTAKIKLDIEQELLDGATLDDLTRTAKARLKETRARLSILKDMAGVDVVYAVDAEEEAVAL